MLALDDPRGAGCIVEPAGAEDLGRLAFDKVVHSRWSPAISSVPDGRRSCFEVSG